MSLAEKFEVIADRVYEKGISDSNNAFWKSFTNKGNRTNYYQAFMYTDYSGAVIPEGLCKPKNRITGMFYNYQGESLPLGVDCSSFASSTNAYHAGNMFQNSASLKSVYDMQLPIQKTYASAFSGCTMLESIAILRSDDDTVWTNAFYSCSNLKEVRIEGSIKQNGFDVSDCKQLTHDSLMSIIDALSTTDTKLTLTLGSTNLNKLTDAEKAIATEKGWTLA